MSQPAFQLDTELACYIENWPAALRSLSLPAVDVPLSLDEALAIGRATAGFAKRFPPLPNGERLLQPLMLKLHAAVVRFPDGAFVRLGSRSPKDSIFVGELKARVFGGRTALMCLTEGSRRIAEDLQRAVAQSYAPHVFIRPWIEIPPWTEFRGFMCKRELVGISQYNGVHERRGFPELIAHAARARAVVLEFFARFTAMCHLADCAFDVVVRRDHENRVYAALIDIAPLGPATDMLLFENHPLDGSFLLLDAAGGLLRIGARG